MPRSVSALVLLAPAALALALPLWAHGVTSPPAEAPRPVACQITVTPDHGLLRVEAWAEADTPLTGQYHFDVTRSGAQISQGGDFAVSPDAPTPLSAVHINGPAHSLRAHLTLTVEGSTRRCSADI